MKLTQITITCSQLYVLKDTFQENINDTRFPITLAFAFKETANNILKEFEKIEPVRYNIFKQFGEQKIDNGVPIDYYTVPEDPEKKALILSELTKFNSLEVILSVYQVSFKELEAVNMLITPRILEILTQTKIIVDENE